MSPVAAAQSIASGAALWTSQACGGCHGTPAGLPQMNAADAVAVLNAAIANNAGGFMNAFAGMNATDRTSIAMYIGSTTAQSQNTAVNFGGSVPITLQNINTSSASSGIPSQVVTSLATVSAPTRGNLGAYNNATAAVTYTHTAANCTADSFTFRGQGSANTSTRTVNITVNAPAPPTSANSTSNIAYSTMATAIPLTLGGGTTNSISASALSPNVGTLNIVGTNVTYTASSTQYAPSVSFTYQAVGPCASSATSTVTINVAAPPAPVITSSNMASGTGGQAFNYAITATNVPTSYSSTALPAGLTLNTMTGVISGTPTVSGTFPVTVSATNGAGTGNLALTITINLATPVITSANTANATSGASFSFQVTASNLPASFGATGLPSGLSIDTNTGLISGTPVVAMGGPVPVMVSATNAAGTGNQTLTITVSLNAPTITSSNMANGSAGAAFSYQITATDFPTSYNATGLPPGLSVNTMTGLISGTPTGPFVGNVMVSATNGSGTGSLSVAFNIVLLAPVITSANTASFQVSFGGSYQITADNFPTSYGATGLPPGLTVNAMTGLVSGVPTVPGNYMSMVSATNATGTGSLAVTFTVSNQPVPNAFSFNQTVAFNAPTVIDLISHVTGNYTSVSLLSQPRNGIANINGLQVTYTPNSGYFGTDSFTFSATGPGGTSSVATATLTVATPGAPTSADRTVAASFGAATAIDLSAAITGVFTNLTITVQPAHGTVTVNGKTVTYTPAAGFFGEDSFTYVANGPGGASAPAVVTINVATQVPVADAVNFILPLNTPTTLELAPFIRGSAISGVSIASAPAHGQVTVNGTKVTFTPDTDFFGSDSFTYTAFGNAGKSSPAIVRVTVVGRPDPSRQANVAGIVTAQRESARRFANAQIGNYQSRMESLHRGGDIGTAPPPAAPAPVPAPAPAPAPAPKAEATAPAVAKVSRFLNDSVAGPVPAGTPFPMAREVVSLLTTRSIDVAGIAQAALDAGSGGAAQAPGAPGFWMAGTAYFGQRNAGLAQADRLDFSTSGLSIGVDRRFSGRLAAGIGLGAARDRTEIGTDGSVSRGRGASAAVYASYHPGANTFIDGLLGVGTLNFKTRRYVAPIDAFANDDRKGTQLFASVAAGYEHRAKGLLLSPYVRLDYAADRLKSSSESGAGLYALHYYSQTTPSLQGVLGLRAETLAQTSYGWALPRARAEYRREFQGDRDAQISYADQVGGPRFTLPGAPVSRNTLVVGVGADFIRRSGLTIGLDYQLNHTFDKNSGQGLKITFTQDLDKLAGAPAALRGFFVIPAKPERIQVDAGYMYDSNVTRGKLESDKRGDRAYSVNVGKGFQWSWEKYENVRANVTYTLGGEKFDTWDGLSRAMLGVEGDVQYRTSADFDAYTFALFGRATAEHYRSHYRRGERYAIGASARQSLTDRVDLFAAVTGNQRYGKSEVFNNRDASARFNVDYALSDRETLYATGEYRRGHIVSTGAGSLENLAIAEVFVEDDAFPLTEFFSYKFKGRTVITTLGYNLGFGPRHSIDISWRRAEATPNHRPSFATSPKSYVADQYTIVYLVRF